MASIAVNYLQDKGYKGVNIFGNFEVQKLLSINIKLLQFGTTVNTDFTKGRCQIESSCSCLPKKGKLMKKQITPNGSYQYTRWNDND